MCSAIEKAMEAARVDYVPKAVKEEKVAKKAAPVEETGSVGSKLKQFSTERFGKEGGKYATYFAEGIKDLTAEFVRRVEEKEALCAMAMLKRISNLVDNVSKDLVPYANREFSDGPGKFDDFSVKKYTPKKVWKYSEEVENKEAELKVLKESERKDGTAIDVSKPFNALESKMFSISLI